MERVELPDAVDLGADDPLAAAGLGGDHEGDDVSGMDFENALTGAAGGDAIGAMAVEYAFPIIRPAIEEQVRRAVVTVYWGEGASERHFNVVQYLVLDQNTQNPGQNAIPNGATPNGATPNGATGAGGAGTPSINLPGGLRR